MIKSVLFQVAQSGWSLDNLIPNAKNKIAVWGGGLVTLLGVVVLFFAAYKFFKAVTSQQGAGKFAMDGGIALLVGGAMTAGGWVLLNSIANGGNQTIKTLGGEAINFVSNNVDFVTQSIHVLF